MNPYNAKDSDEMPQHHPQDTYEGGGAAGAATLPTYALRCRACGATYEDDGYLLECREDHGPALLVSQYTERRFEPDDRTDGLFRYRNWLPSRRVLPGVGCTVTYQSEELIRITGLPNLWVAFNGYWPEKGARLETGTFKELEAWTVLSRLPDQDDTVLVVASAGNTAAAFARACSVNDVACLIVVPETALPGLQFVDALQSSVKIVTLGGLSDYYDAIQVADRVSLMDGFVSEGGVKNVGRREGLGSALLNAVETIGRLPDYYFQAVGSGAGGIAAYEAADRLVEDGRFGELPPKLMLSQNLPFAPMHHSWQAGSRELLKIAEDVAKDQVQEIVAQVLSNRRPPYATCGGVFDALTDTGGDLLAADNQETVRARRLFEEAEGIDIDPAAGVAMATLLAQAGDGRIDREAVTLLNITGGGRRRLMKDTELVPARSSLRLRPDELKHEDTPARVAALFGR